MKPSSLVEAALLDQERRILQALPREVMGGSRIQKTAIPKSAAPKAVRRPRDPALRVLRSTKPCRKCGLLISFHAPQPCGYCR